MEPAPNYNFKSDERFIFLVEKDLQRMFSRIKLAVGKLEGRHLRTQSLVGHAQQGHGAFSYRAKHGRTMDGAAIYPNTDTYEVIAALSRKTKNPEDYLERKLRERGNVVGRIRSWLIRAANGEPLERLVDKERPLGGIELFKREDITDPLAVVQGYLFGVSMDNFEARRRVKEQHNLEMGGGEHHIINFEALRASGLTLEKLAAIPFAENVPVKQLSPDLWELEEGDGIEWLAENGIIIPNPRKNGLFTPEERPAYVRLVQGLGVSDDAAIIMGTFLYGGDFGLGVLLADAVDTWDKAMLRWQASGKGADEQIAKEIIKIFQRKSKILLPDPDEVTRFIGLSAIDPARSTQYPDCSQRRFLQYARNGKQKNGVRTYPLILHREFATALRDKVGEDGNLDGSGAMTLVRTSFPEIRISFSEVSIRHFYTEIIRRINQYQRKYGPISNIMK